MKPFSLCPKTFYCGFIRTLVIGFFFFFLYFFVLSFLADLVFMVFTSASLTHRWTPFLFCFTAYIIPSLPFFCVPTGNSVADCVGEGRLEERLSLGIILWFDFWSFGLNIEFFWIGLILTKFSNLVYCENNYKELAKTNYVKKNMYQTWFELKKFNKFEKRERKVEEETNNVMIDICNRNDISRTCYTK